MKDLEFLGIPEEGIESFADGVLSTLDQLGFTYVCDETSPPDDDEEVTYRVIGVEKDPGREGTVDIERCERQGREGILDTQ